MKASARVALFATSALVLGLSAGPLAAQENDLIEYGTLRVKLDGVVPGVGRIVIPESGLAKPGRMRTHYEIVSTTRPVMPPSVDANGVLKKAAVTAVAETPASLACVYKLVAQTSGCDPDKVSKVAKGGSKAIGIVDAYHNPTVKKDLKAFSTNFGLPQADLTVVYCSASTCQGVTAPPDVDQGWAGEIALDVQAAHAMAPKAKIILVEAFSASFTDIFRAVDRAKQLVAAAGGGQVSNSYGGNDAAFDFTPYNSHYEQNKVTFFASTGDHKGGTNVADVEWPSTAPNVIAAGGTRIVRNAANSAFLREEAWIDGGGGISKFQDRPSYQKSIKGKVGNKRGVPDIAADADPASGMFVYCKPSTCGQPQSSGNWLVIGGTSLASPLLAGMTNAAGSFRASSTDELKAIYQGLGGTKYNDVVKGKCGNGPNGSFVAAKAGWDFCSGVGTPDGTSGL